MICECPLRSTATHTVLDFASLPSLRLRAGLLTDTHLLRYAEISSNSIIDNLNSLQKLDRRRRIKLMGSTLGGLSMFTPRIESMQRIPLHERFMHSIESQFTTFDVNTDRNLTGKYKNVRRQIKPEISRLCVYIFGRLEGPRFRGGWCVRSFGGLRSALLWLDESCTVEETEGYTVMPVLRRADLMNYRCAVIITQHGTCQSKSSDIRERSLTTFANKSQGRRSPLQKTPQKERHASTEDLR